MNGLRRTLRELGCTFHEGQCQKATERQALIATHRDQQTGTFRSLRCGLTLSADLPQFQTCSSHSITKGLLVTKQPLPYLLYLP